jgi:hypothetical protein
LILFLLMSGFAAISPARADQSSERPGAGKLEAADKEALAGALRLKADLGEAVWPGFGNADIPVIVYDDEFEYLFRLPNPPPPWDIVVGDDYLGQTYFRRPAKDPQSFAVDLGGRWAGSLSSLGRMNRKIPFKLGPDWYGLGLLHELFHAFQAEANPAKFAAARESYSLEDRYPFKNEELTADWNAEGAALSRALNASDPVGMTKAVIEFFRIRDGRRDSIGLARDLVRFERRMEWLEGLAKYAEVRADELAVARADQDAYARFRPGLHFLVRADFARLAGSLGRQEGDLRFYLSGMAIARLLDRLDPGWKRRAFTGRTELEDLLRSAIKKRYPMSDPSPSSRPLGEGSSLHELPEK